MVPTSGARLVKRHGTDAALNAAQRVDELRADGDTDGCAVWIVDNLAALVAELDRSFVSAIEAHPAQRRIGIGPKARGVNEID
jgi:hypothetical protein